MLLDFGPIAKPTLGLGEIPAQKCHQAKLYRVDESPENVVRFAEVRVEHGIAPESIVVSGKPGGVAVQRPVCPYPQVARYRGSGDVNEATSFVCADSGTQKCAVLVEQGGDTKLRRVGWQTRNVHLGRKS